MVRLLCPPIKRSLNYEYLYYIQTFTKPTWGVARRFSKYRCFPQRLPTWVLSSWPTYSFVLQPLHMHHSMSVPTQITNKEPQWKIKSQCEAPTLHNHLLKYLLSASSSCSFHLVPLSTGTTVAHLCRFLYLLRSVCVLRILADPQWLNHSPLLLLKYGVFPIGYFIQC